jgi:predicted phage terminase large subunit-like protein
LTLKKLDSADLAVIEAWQISQAKTNLGTFTRYTFPKYRTGWFAEQIDYELGKFYDDICAGKQPRLMIFAPPRHGKSEKFSRRFPAWAFGRNPNLQIIAASYSADLAYRMNRDVQRIIDCEKYRKVFPDTTLNMKNVKTVSTAYMRNADLFEIVGHKGAYRAAGVGGGITGMGADIGIIDDPVKDKSEARSVTVQNSVYEWYTSTFYTRLSEMSGVLLGMTRWHNDDLAGRLIKEAKNGATEWRVVSFPAIAEQDEYFYTYSDGETDYGLRANEHGESPAEKKLLRRAGEPLHAERFSLDRLIDIRNTTQATGDWDALYQQKPVTKGGNLFRTDKFGYYQAAPICKHRIITADTAQKKGEHNDYTVMQCWGFLDGRAYLLDLMRARMSAPELLIASKAFYAKHKADQVQGSLRGMHIEDKSSGTGLIQQIKSEGHIPVIPIPRTKDKLTRAFDALPYVDGGLVMLPHSSPWLSDFLAEVSAFSADMKHAHDDQIDPMMDAVEILLSKANKQSGFLAMA